MCFHFFRASTIVMIGIFICSVLYRIPYYTALANSFLNYLGLATPVKNQKACGSCSAFASAAMHETCLINAGAPMANLDLSEQQLVDCAYDNKDAFGCEGAYIRAYPNWLANKNYGYVNHENNYPYLNAHPNLKCQNVPHWNAGARVTRALGKNEPT